MSYLKLEVELTQNVNFVVQQQKVPIIKTLKLINSGTEPLANLLLTIRSKPDELCMPCTVPIDSLPAGKTLDLKATPLLLNPEFLAKLTEKLVGGLEFAVTCGDRELLRDSRELSVLAYDEWNASGELLPAFVTPNEKTMIPKILGRASEILGASIVDPSLDSYFGDANRVKKCAAAIFSAIQEYKIVYATLKPSFERCGQKVRLVQEIFRNKLANCMDFTCLLAACLEAAALNPIMVLTSGHIYCGVWLVNKTFPSVIVRSSADLLSHMGEGRQELLVFESTYMRNGVRCSFDDAVRSSTNSLKTDGMVYCVDVKQARLSGVKPLPEVQEVNGVLRLMLADPEASDHAEPEQIHQFDDDSKPMNYDKRQLWEASLLNMDLRNPLLNQRYGGKTIPLFADDLPMLVEALSSGANFTIHPLDSDMTAKDFESLSMLRNRPLFASELGNKRLHTTLSEKELPKLMKGLYMDRNTALDQSGANTLFLSVAGLRWMDKKSPKKPLYAPLLLIPLDIEYKNNVYRFRIREEEIMLNATVMEKVRSDYRLKMPTWDELPLTKNGVVDIRKIMAIVRKAIADQPKWDVIPCAAIAHFSFAKFAMWRDLHENPDVLEASALVKSLMAGKLTWVPDYDKFKVGIPSNTLVLPLTTDGSQLFAIEQAGDGESFVLHGPPGTGKSQCITALISYAISRGQKVLLVSEKLAALNVPQSRLEQLGLAPYCLELHSSKAKIQHVLKKYSDLIEMANAGAEPARAMSLNASTREYCAKLRKHTELRGELDRYGAALHAQRSCGSSLHSLIGRYADLPDGTHFSGEALEKLQTDEEQLSQQEELMAKLSTICQALGDIAEHPLYRLCRTELSPREGDRLRQSLTAYDAALTELGNAGNTFAEAYRLPAPEVYEDYRKFSELAGHLQTWSKLPKQWTDGDLEAAVKPVETLASDMRRMKRMESQLLQTWAPAFLDLDGQMLADRYNRCLDRNAFLGNLGLRQLTRQLAPYYLADTPLQPALIASQITQLCAYQALRQDVSDSTVDHNELETAFGADAQNWKLVQQTIDSARDVSRMLGTLCDRYSSNGFDSRPHRSLMLAWEKVEHCRQNCSQLLGNTAPLDDGHWDVASEQELCRHMLEDLGSLREWNAFNRLCRSARSGGLGPVVDAIMEGNPPEAVMAGFRKAVCRSMIEGVIEEDPILQEFTGIEFSQQIELFRQLDSSLTKLSREQICKTMSERTADVVHSAARSGGGLTALNKAIAAQGKTTTLRKLFAQHTDLLLELTPCLLMSPLSVAQYLPMKADLFDLVIFDEASQLTAANAVGAIARGKTCVICGDNRQMPPTSFFCANTVDDENPEIMDMESILDDCLALNMPGTHLRWHYRSRHESLIRFSNHFFYENKLLTFPSATDRNSHVHLELVEDGIFDRGKSKCNPAEADAVIRRLQSMSRDPLYKDRSVAVITSNINQQGLVDDKLTQACKADETLARWLRERREPLLIQNLENVQGHERDVVLFSLGYGPDADGSVTMNFGPLNQEGGWRRFNVAITRACEEFVIFSSIRPEQIRLTETSSQGVIALRRFLEYAAGTELPAHRAAAASPDTDGIAADLIRQLKEAGYDAVQNVGHSELRVDIAVVDPKHPDQFLLGILLDGASYCTAKTTRDRELAHSDVLKSLGWNLHRIWTMDYWDDRGSGKQLRSILEKLHRLSDGATDAESA